MGVLDEMMTEAVDSAMDNPDLEEETDEEVQRVLEDVLGGKNHDDIPKKTSLLFFSEKIKGIPSVVPEEATPVPAVVEDNDEFERRLQQLKA